MSLHFQWGLKPKKTSIDIYADNRTRGDSMKLFKDRVSNTVLAKIISGLPDKMSSKSSMLCGTFWSPVRHFSQLMTSNSFLSCWTFSMHWTLPDKMSCNVGALCQTARRHFFSNCVIDMWNDVPEEVVSAWDVDTFKEKLDQHWSSKYWLYDFEAEL